MHLNYLFLQYLSAELSVLLQGAKLLEAYTPEKEVLVLEFELKRGALFFLKCDWTSDFHGLYFPEDYRKPSRNWVPIFKSLHGKQVVGVRQRNFDRSFLIDFQDEVSLDFRLFGSTANVFLIEQSACVDKFRNSTYEVYSSKADPEFSFDSFRGVEGNIMKYFPVGGPVFRTALQEQGYNTATLAEQWELMQELQQQCASGKFYVCKWNHEVILTVFKIGEVLHEFENAMDAVNVFSRLHFAVNLFESRRRQLIEVLSKKIKAQDTWIRNASEALERRTLEAPLSQQADLIMANLHQIKEGQEFLTCLNFYTGKEELIPLKKSMSPQKYAEQLYRKSKNRHLELERTQGLIEARLQQRSQLLVELALVEGALNLKELQQRWRLHTGKVSVQEEEVLPYKEYRVDGFVVLVGRNAKANDELTLHIAKKDDLWLHARDVSGSHVIIRWQSGKTFPKQVLEKAAALAAWYSKRRNESLCPVMYTEKKNVRKVKGAAPGSVKVEKEKVLMVVPADFVDLLLN